MLVNGKMQKKTKQTGQFFPLVDQTRVRGCVFNMHSAEKAQFSFIFYIHGSYSVALFWSDKLLNA